MIIDRPFCASRWSAYYINLDSRSDRRQQVEDELAAHRIPAQRFTALTGYDASKFPELQFSSRIARGAIGCWLSHYALLQQHLQMADSRPLAVFEDDAYFCDDFGERLAYLDRNMTVSWDMFYLSAFFSSTGCWYDFDHSPTAIPHVHRLFGAFTTHGYLVNPASLPGILESLRRYAAHAMAVDEAYIWMQPDLNVYGAVPGMVGQRAGVSDIVGSEADHTGGHLRISGRHVFARRVSEFPYEAWLAQQPVTMGAPSPRRAMNKPSG